MLKMKKIFSLVLIFTMLASLLVACGNDNVKENEVKIETITYSGSAHGHNDLIKVEVDLEDGNIRDIRVVSHNETKVLTDPVFEDLLDQIIEKNSLNIDMVAGATITSMGLSNAIKNALAESGLDLSKGERVSLERTYEEDQAYDVVIIGAGGAGLVAAIEARSHDKSVLILEKMPFVGGNTLVSGGEFNAPNSWVQELLDVEDSVDAYFEDTLKAGDFKGDEALVRILAEEITEGGNWLRDYVGVEFIEDYLMHFGGHRVPRAIYPKGGTGVELVQKLEAKAKADGVEIRFYTEAKELIRDENGRVVGVKALNQKDESLSYYANDGVIIASGGFGANLEMTKMYNEEIDERFKWTVQNSTTGDGIIIGQAIDADLVGMEYIQVYPTCNPLTGHLSYVADTRFDGAILVNKEGNRFVEELERRDVISMAILDQTDGFAYLLWDNELKENSSMKNHMIEFENLKRQNLIVEAESLEEAAEFFDIDVENLRATIDRYNEFAANGRDEDFNHRGKIASVTDGPFYLQKVTPAIHHTMGGLRINENTQVINSQGEVIEGLYAAGEVTGGIHGANRLGGNAISDLIVFGRRAGRNIGK